MRALLAVLTIAIGQEGTRIGLAAVRRTCACDTLHLHAVQLSREAACQSPARTHASRAGDRRYVGEPVFVACANRKSQDDGYVIVCVHDLTDPERETNCIEILDGLALEDGPICTIALSDLTPPGLHGSWSTRVVPRQRNEMLPTSSDVRYSL